MRTMVAAAILLPALALAQVPQKLGYQGRLLKADGTPETGSVAITFAIYDAETAGTLQWSEVQPVELTNGFYSVFVGDQTPFPTDRNIFDGRPLWLEVTVGSSAPLTPRQRIASVAYALTATNVTGGTVNATSVSVSGPVNASGTVTFTGDVSVPTPTQAAHATRKDYVDGKFPISRSSLPAVGQQISNSSGGFYTTSSSQVAVTNLSASITTAGRPVVVAIQPVIWVPGPVRSGISCGASYEGEINIRRSGTTITSFMIHPNVSWPGLLFIDPVGAGTYTYSIYADVGGGNTLSIANMVLVLYKL